jgi:hypothetical protein
MKIRQNDMIKRMTVKGATPATKATPAPKASPAVKP